MRYQRMEPIPNSRSVPPEIEVRQEMTISGAEEPIAIKVEPATSSFISHLAQRDSREGTSRSSHTYAGKEAGRRRIQRQHHKGHRKE